MMAVAAPRSRPDHRARSACVGVAALLLGLAAPALPGPVAHAGSLPLWEAGAGIAVLNFPDYRGSDERRTWMLPFPYVVYRGDFLKVEEGRVRGLFFRTERAELDVSVTGTVPVKSSGNEARRGMPDLDPTAEVGPTLNFTLARGGTDRTSLTLRLPVRAVLASDFSSIRHVGWTFQPNLNLDVRHAFGYNGWNFGLMAGPVYSDRRHNRYFYAVDPVFATPARPAYDARGGYAGAQALASVSRRYRQLWIGGFVRADTLKGAVFEDSPLVRTRSYHAAGVAIAWVLGESRRRVEPTR